MRVRVIITGSVQGVGYRQFVKSNALRLEINGWVKNLADGSVEAFFQGDAAKVEELLGLCKKGPFLADVKDVLVTKATSDEVLSGFQILHDIR